jgi:hypothetical protein
MVCNARTHSSRIYIQPAEYIFRVDSLAKVHGWNDLRPTMNQAFRCNHVRIARTDANRGFARLGRSNRLNEAVSSGVVRNIERLLQNTTNTKHHIGGYGVSEISNQKRSRPAIITFRSQRQWLAICNGSDLALF